MIMSSAYSSKRWNPLELDVYDRVMNTLCEEQDQVRRAQRQQLERLRYQPQLAEPPVSEVRP